jgi:hypothetical protein
MGAKTAIQHKTCCKYPIYVNSLLGKDTCRRRTVHSACGGTSPSGPNRKRLKPHVIILIPSPHSSWPLVPFTGGIHGRTLEENARRTDGFVKSPPTSKANEAQRWEASARPPKSACDARRAPTGLPQQSAQLGGRRKSRRGEGARRTPSGRRRRAPVEIAAEPASKPRGGFRRAAATAERISPKAAAELTSGKDTARSRAHSIEPAAGEHGDVGWGGGVHLAPATSTRRKPSAASAR